MLLKHTPRPGTGNLLSMGPYLQHWLVDLTGWAAWMSPGFSIGLIQGLAKLGNIVSQQLKIAHAALLYSSVATMLHDKYHSKFVKLLFNHSQILCATRVMSDKYIPVESLSRRTI